MSKKRKQVTNVHRYRRSTGKAKTSGETKEKTKKIPTPVLLARGQQTQRKNLNIRKEFEKAKKSYEARLVHEQAFREAIGAGSIETKVKTPFQITDYESVTTKGIRRKIDKKMQTFVGKQAVKIQTLSLKARGSGGMQRDLFVDNYIQAGIRSGYSPMSMLKVGGMLRDLDPDAITLMIYRGYLPSISYLYGDTTTSENDLIERIQAAIDISTGEELKRAKEKAKELVPYIQLRG